MPFFMDRHDIRGATPEDVAGALCMGKKHRFASLGAAMLKGFDEPTNLELVLWQD